MSDVPNSEPTMSLALAHELDLSFRRNGWEAKDVKLLAAGQSAAKVLSFLKAGCVPSYEASGWICDIDRNAIDTEGSKFSVREHSRLGAIEAETKFQLICVQADATHSQISDVLAIASGSGLTAHFCDFYWRNKQMIPSHWRGKNIIFPGTVLYNHHDKVRYYRRLTVWTEGTVERRVFPVDGSMGRRDYVAFLPK